MELKPRVDYHGVVTTTTHVLVTWDAYIVHMSLHVIDDIILHHHQSAMYLFMYAVLRHHHLTLLLHHAVLASAY